MQKLQISDRMKDYYEKVYNYQLPMRLPVIIRIDGKNFHRFTKDFERPIDTKFSTSMVELAEYLLKEIHTARFAYIQSDEISILLHNYNKRDTQAWFNNEVQKITSVSAGLASSWLSLRYQREAVFDSRVFVIPEHDVVNYFIWRQQDAIRNSVSMHVQNFYGHKDLLNKNTKDKKELLLAMGIDWDKDVPLAYQRGSAVYRDICKHQDSLSDNCNNIMQENMIPLFTEDRDFITQFLLIQEP